MRTRLGNWLERISTLSMASLFAFGVLAAAAPVFFGSSAVAAPGLVYSSTGFDSLGLSPDRTTPSGGYTVDSNSLELRINNNNASPSTGFSRTEGLKGSFSVSRSISAELYVNPDWSGKPIRAGLWGVASSATGPGVSWPIIEYTTIGGDDGSFIGWRVFDTVNGGWTNLPSVTAASGSWYKLDISYNPATRSYDYYVNGTLVTSKTAASGSDVYDKLQGVIFDNFNSATGSHDQDYTVDWRNFSTGQAPSLTACSTLNTITTTNLSSWDLSASHDGGTSTLQPGGLHVSAPGLGKAAGYHTTNFALANLGSFDLDWSGTGTAPGGQLVVDLDGNGTKDGILVIEPTYNSDIQWLAAITPGFDVTYAPHVSGGGGYANQGTFNDWLSVYPAAKVLAVGYSLGTLGSGQSGNGVISSITAGCTKYTFDVPVNHAPSVPVLSSPANGVYRQTDSTSPITNQSSWNASTDPDGDSVTYIYQSAFDYSFNNLAYTSSPLSDTFILNPSEPEVTYYWHVKAVDSHGLASDWSAPWQINIDNAAPTKPVHLSPNDNALINYNDFYFDWTDVSGAVSYEMQNSQSPDVDSDGSFQNVLWTGDYQHVQPTASTSRSVGANGTWYWQVRAIDAAGNKSAWTTPWKVTIDTQAPAAPTTTSPKPYYTNSSFATKTLTWTASTSSDVDHYEYAEYYNVSPTSDSTHEDWLKPVNGTSTTDTAWGSNVTIFWRVRAVDHAGNKSAWSDIGQIITDVDAPAAPTLVSPADNTVTKGTSITQSWSDASSDVDHYIYESYNDAAATSLRFGQSYNTTSKTATNVSNTTYWWRVKAVDVAGNASAWSLLWKITVDNDGPVLTSTTPVTTDTTITPVVTATDPSDPLTYSWVADPSNPSSNIISDSTVLNPVFTPAADGHYTFVLTATDAAGNSSHFPFSFDYAAPVVTNQTTAPAPSTAPAPQPTFTNVSSAPAVLGAQTDTPNTPENTDNASDNTGVLGTNTDNTNTKDNKGGLAWYWWTLIALVAIGLGWLVAWLRSRNSEEN